MATVARERTVAGTPEDMWPVIVDPEHLPRWWPGVQRVEEATATAWTTVLSSKRGRSVRADYTLLAAEAPHRLAWQHEVEESPFERILAESRFELELHRVDEGTRVRLSQHVRLRGFARLGVLQVRRATRRTLDGALEGLERIFGGAPS